MENPKQSVLKVNGKSLDLPLSLAEMSTELWQKLADKWDCEDPLQAFSIITNIDLQNQKFDEQTAKAVLKVVSWLFDYIIVKDNVRVLGFPNFPGPTKILGVEVPKFDGNNIGSMAELNMGQVFMIGKLASLPNPCTAISSCIACVLYEKIEGKEWNRKGVDELEKRIKQLPILETFQLASFFLHKLQNLKIIGRRL